MCVSIPVSEVYPHGKLLGIHQKDKLPSEQKKSAAMFIDHGIHGKS